MPKIKTKRAAAKRFKMTGNGELKEKQGFQEPHPDEEDYQA